MKQIFRCARSLGGAALIYVAAYAFFSAQGSYEQVPQGFIGQVQWSPAIEFRAAKALYRPLIEIDRRFVHPSYHRC